MSSSLNLELALRQQEICKWNRMRDQPVAFVEIATMTKDDGFTYLDGPTLYGLINSNFPRLAHGNSTIGKEDILLEISNEQSFSKDEFEMLRVLNQYFELVASMSDDADVGTSRISRNDVLVLEQFLVHSKMTFAQLLSWSQEAMGPSK